MKKRMVAAMMAVLMGLGMAGCKSTLPDGMGEEVKNADGTLQEGTDNGKNTPVTIRFYNYAMSETAKAKWWEEKISDFEEENDWIDIETVTVDYNSMVSTFTNDIASGLSVDIVYGEISWIPSLAEAGFIQPPSQVLSPEYYDGYYDYVLEQFEYNGEAYGVPHYYTNSVIFVNKELIEGAGLSLDNFPDTLDGLKDWIETLSDHYKSEDGVSTIFGLTTAEVPATGSNINAIYTAFGGTLINEDGTLADLTSEKNKTAMSETLDFYKYLISNGYTQENLKLKDYRAAFGAGNVCMYVDSAWGYAQIGEVDAGAADFTATAALPTTMGTYGNGDSLVESHCFLFGSSLTEGQKEAVDLFIQYCTSTDTMESYLTNIGTAFPAHKNMSDCKIAAILDGASKGVSHVVTQPMTASLSSVQIELATMVLNYVANDMSKEDAINNYIQQANYYINQ